MSWARLMLLRLVNAIMAGEGAVVEARVVFGDGAVDGRDVVLR